MIVGSKICDNKYCHLLFSRKSGVITDFQCLIHMIFTAMLSSNAYESVSVDVQDLFFSSVDVLCVYL